MVQTLYINLKKNHLRVLSLNKKSFTFETAQRQQI
jgi:hypothetical protein